MRAIADNRLDETIMFKPLTKDIVDLMVKLLLKRLADVELTVALVAASTAFVIDCG